MPKPNHLNRSELDALEQAHDALRVFYENLAETDIEGACIVAEACGRLGFIRTSLEIDRKAERLATGTTRIRALLGVPS